MTYVERINRIALQPPTRDPKDDPMIELTGQMAALLANAADAGHVTPAVHSQLEELIRVAEAKTNMLH